MTTMTTMTTKCSHKCVCHTSFNHKQSLYRDKKLIYTLNILH